MSFGRIESSFCPFNFAIANKAIYHILVDDKAKILPCNKTLSFV
jgi:hypothetical protein